MRPQFIVAQVTRTGHLFHFFFAEVRLVDGRFAAAPAKFSVVFRADYKSHDGPTTIRFQPFVAEYVDIDGQ